MISHFLARKTQNQLTIFKFKKKVNALTPETNGFQFHQDYGII
jgi:hypothetical protein